MAMIAATKSTNLADIYFKDLQSHYHKWGFGVNRVLINIQGATAVKFYGFGYKDANGYFHVGVRSYNPETPPKFHQWLPNMDSSQIQNKCTELAYALFYEIQ